MRLEQATASGPSENDTTLSIPLITSVASSLGISEGISDKLRAISAATVLVVIRLKWSIRSYLSIGRGLSTELMIPFRLQHPIQCQDVHCIRAAQSARCGILWERVRDGAHGVELPGALSPGALVTRCTVTRCTVTGRGGVSQDAAECGRAPCDGARNVRLCSIQCRGSVAVQCCGRAQ